MNTEQRIEQIRERQKWRANAQRQNGRTPESNQEYADINILLSIVKSQEATPSDVDQLLFRLAAQTCEHLVAGMRDCTNELPFAEWCVVCQSRGLLQKYARGGTREDEVATAMRSKCIEKVKQLRECYHSYANAADANNDHGSEYISLHKASAAAEIIKELESVSIEQEAGR